jgi:hypothetical protein
MPHDAAPPSPPILTECSHGISDDESQESHHLQRKIKPAGSKRQQLTAEDAVEIFAMRPKDKGTKISKRGSMVKCKIIGPQFGVSPKTIRDIWRGRTWTDATKNLWTLGDTPPTRKNPSNPKSRNREAHSDTMHRTITTENTRKATLFSTGREIPSGLNANIPAWHHRSPHSHSQSRDPTMLSCVNYDPSDADWSRPTILFPRQTAPPQPLPSPTAPHYFPTSPPFPLSPPPPPAQQHLPPAVAALLLSSLLRISKPPSPPPCWPAPAPQPSPPARSGAGLPAHWQPPLLAMAALAAAGAQAPLWRQ